MMKDSRNILITGGGGHIGFKLLKELIKKYENIYVLEKIVSKELDSLIKEKDIKLIECDLTDINSLKEFKRDFEKMDVVLHLAAYVPKTADADNEEEATKVNLTGTMNLVKCLKEGSKFIFISTCEVYGIPKSEVINEEHPLNPLSNYGKSKAAAETSLLDYSKNNKIVLTILRLTNVYGPGEIISRAILNFIKAVTKNETPTIYGDGSDKRDFMYVDDIVMYIIAAIEKGDNNIYNVVTGKSYTIKEIAEQIIKIAGADINIKFEAIKKAKMNYVFDSAKVRKDLEYAPKIDIDEGLSREMGWFKNA